MENEVLRLNQALSRLGLCSRRKADKLIESGQILINGKLASEFNIKVNIKFDKITISNEVLKAQRCSYIVVNKPKGIVTTRSDENNRMTIIDILPVNLRHLKPIGRLDKNSSGLILLTDDGYFANKITHPSNHIPKTYYVRVQGHLTSKSARQLATGIELDDCLTAPAQVHLISANKDYSEFEIVLTEGRNRQIRRMCEKIGHRIKILSRISIGGLQLNGLREGQFRFLNKQELNHLKGLKYDV